MKTIKYRKGLLAILMGCVLCCSACGETTEGRHANTPREAMDATMESLKDLDLEAFNECTDNYVDSSHNWLGMPTGEEYRVFNELLLPGAKKRKRYESDYELAQEIVKCLSWEIKEIEESDGKAKIRMEIANRDMLQAVGNYEMSVMEDMTGSHVIGIGDLMVGISELLENNDGLIAEINRLGEEDISIMEVTVLAYLEDGCWKIHLSDAFINAFMGNMNAME